MKDLVYNIIRFWVKIGLYGYFGKIKVAGLAHVPKDKPILFLSNHQNALLDALLIGVDCNRKPYYLTRADVFKNGTMSIVLDFFRLIPIYRIRDGRKSLKNNQAVFDYCADLLKNNNAILMFPEGSHNLKRRVRPLSKGFTRVLFSSLAAKPNLDIRIVPIGINYKDAVRFPDRVSLFFGKDIAVQDYYNATDLNTSIVQLKEVVSNSLKNLTTHIANEENYEETIKKLDAVGADYLKPQAVKLMLHNLTTDALATVKKTRNKSTGIFDGLFTLLNFPIVLIWRIFVKPKIKEPEFIGTMRYGFAMIGYPIYYLLLFVIFALATNPITALLSIFCLFVFNWVYVRLGSRFH